MRITFITILFILIAGLVMFSPPAHAVTINEFTVSTDLGKPFGIAQGPDGNLWVTEYVGNKIVRITTSGIITEFTISGANKWPHGITPGPDGNLWFTEEAGKIGRITTSGVITEFNIPTAGSEPYSIVEGSDRNLWFTEYLGNKIGRITTSGVITEYAVPTYNSYPFYITAGPDGNLWFTEELGNKIGRITTSGVISEFKIPSAGSWCHGITAGPDGNLWFAEKMGKIGRITTSGGISEYPVSAMSWPYDIAVGPDGNLWLTEEAGKIGRITTAGVITEYAIPTVYGLPYGIAAGPDSNIWFTEYGSEKIGHILLESVPHANWTLSVSLTGTGSGTVTANSGTISWSGNTGTASYSSGTRVKLTAAANSGATFTGWSGACSSQSASATCIVPMNKAEAVTAHYIIKGKPTFDDVPSTSPYETYIEAIYNNGITPGCGHGNYCPSSDVAKGTMAAFIIRALYGETFSYTQTPYFSDMPATDNLFKYVQKLKDLNITTRSGTYSSDRYVTWDEMPAFFVRATQVKAGQSTESFADPQRPYFTGVTAGSKKDLSTTTAAGTHSGDQTVTRDQLAEFIARAFLGMK